MHRARRGNGRLPNSRLPALVYRGALPADVDAMTRIFAANGWSNAWVDGIFPYHHFHSIAHEVLGVASGEVRVVLGGPEGRTLSLKAGDVVVIPAGVAHRNVGQSDPLAVVGAYPGGADWDVKRGEPGEYDTVAKVARARRRLYLDFGLSTARLHAARIGPKADRNERAFSTASDLHRLLQRRSLIVARIERPPYAFGRTVRGRGCASVHAKDQYLFRL